MSLRPLCHSGQLSLLLSVGQEISTGQGAVAVAAPLGWEGNRRSDVAQTLWYIYLQDRFSSLRVGEEHLVIHSSGSMAPITFIPQDNILGVFYAITLSTGVDAYGMVVGAAMSQVVYVTAVVPYVVLIILLIWNAQLEGAWLGLKFYLVPDWSKLGTAKVRYTFAISISEH